MGAGLFVVSGRSWGTAGLPDASIRKDTTPVLRARTVIESQVSCRWREEAAIPDDFE
jgi:hypothetical protein